MAASSGRVRWGHIRRRRVLLRSGLYTVLNARSRGIRFACANRNSVWQSAKGRMLLYALLLYASTHPVSQTEGPVCQLAVSPPASVGGTPSHCQQAMSLRGVVRTQARLANRQTPSNPRGKYRGARLFSRPNRTSPEPQCIRSKSRGLRPLSIRLSISTAAWPRLCRSIFSISFKRGVWCLNVAFRDAALHRRKVATA